MRISLLGVVSVTGRAQQPVHLGIAGPTLELLAYLLTFAGHPLRRDRLADVIWQNLDEGRSRAALSTALWRVRQVTRKLGGVSLQSDSDNVRLGLAGTVVTDTAELKRVTRPALAAFAKDKGLPADLRIALHEVMTRQAGEFLEGFTSSWVLAEREEYLDLRIRGLAMLMQDAGLRAAYEDALHYGRRILALDAFRESVHCQMLWLLTMTGRRANAIRHYRDYAEMLKRELGIQPMAEMRAVHDMICADDNSAAGAPANGAPAVRGGRLASRLLDEIKSVKRDFYRAHFATGV